MRPDARAAGRVNRPNETGTGTVVRIVVARCKDCGEIVKSNGGHDECGCTRPGGLLEQWAAEAEARRAARTPARVATVNRPDAQPDPVMPMEALVDALPEPAEAVLLNVPTLPASEPEQISEPEVLQGEHLEVTVLEETAPAPALVECPMHGVSLDMGQGCPICAASPDPEPPDFPEPEDAQ